MTETPSEVLRQQLDALHVRIRELEAEHALLTTGRPRLALAARTGGAVERDALGAADARAVSIAQEIQDARDAASALTVDVRAAEATERERERVRLEEDALRREVQAIEDERILNQEWVRMARSFRDLLAAARFEHRVELLDRWSAIIHGGPEPVKAALRGVVSPPSHMGFRALAGEEPEGKNEP